MEVINNKKNAKIKISVGKKNLNSASANKQAYILNIIAKIIPKNYKNNIN